MSNTEVFLKTCQIQSCIYIVLIKTQPKSEVIRNPHQSLVINRKIKKI